MRVSLIKTENIVDILLPQRMNGNVWITDFDVNGHEQNLISIEASVDGWKLVSNEEYGCFLNNMFIPSIILKEYMFYVIKSKADGTLLILYCSPTKDKTYRIYNYNNSEITIGFNPACSICYNNPNVDSIQAKISYDQGSGKFVVMDNNSRSGLYVNNIRVNKSCKLENGDIIYLMGLKIIISKCDKEYKIIFNNPNNLVKSQTFTLPSQLSEIENPFPEETDELEFNLYKDEDYFNKKPRFLQNIEELQMNVDAPPTKAEKEDNSLILTVGPMLTMSMTSLMTGYMAINNVKNNGATWQSAIPSLVMCLAMFCSIFIWPLIIKNYQKRKEKRNEKMRQKKYSQYIDEKKKLIADALIKQANILRDKYPSTLECQNIITQKLTRLWERRTGDDDFGVVNLGYGSLPLKINIKYPEDHFSMVEDNLKQLVSELGNAPKNMSNVPISFSFIENRILGIIGTPNNRAELMKQLFLQLITFHSYDDLKIVILTNQEDEHYWDFVKILPHNWSNDKLFRYFASNADEYKEICYLLGRELNERQKKDGNFSKVQYIIMTDSLMAARNFEFIKNILDLKEDLGFSLVMLDKKITNIPNQCQDFIEVNNDRNEYYKTLINNKPIPFELDKQTNIHYYDCAKSLANLPIKITDDTDGQLPDKLGFLELYDIGKVEQFNIVNRWQKNNPILSLAAPIGIGKSGEKISIDLHEKYHGPHGLIAGMTGSGKSEFIISYILSMAINYHPYEVQFILIDYKGGGLAGAFENSSTGLKLPHLVGTITNLDANEIKRSLASIESELKRRQKLFNEARKISEESTIDIYKYQKMYRDGIVKEPISHLFIISDEFAELKNQQPEFMEQLISAARIGRSLGVHLILATQKPSGVVDPQIWSNTRFRVCLRVQEKNDSNEVIKTPEAAYLKQTGRFYFQVGYNEIFVLGQAAWAGGKYIPAEKIKKNIDTSLKFVNNIGYIVKSVDTKRKNEVVTSNGEELINIVKYIDNIATQEKISCKPLWLAKIPAFITIDNLINEFKYQKEDFVINPIIGKYDDPSMQSQHMLTIPLSEKGNSLIYGVAGSGKENMILTMVYSSMMYYRPEELNYYIIDFGSESLRVLKDSPIVGDVLYPDDNDKIANMYRLLNNEIEKRKKLFADYNGSYRSYCKNSGSSVPSMIVIINNYEAYVETYPDFEETLIPLTRDGSKYGIYFILSLVTPSGVKFKIKQNFNQEFVLQQNSEDDYATILGNVHKNYPSKIYGRGIIKLDKIYEFQTAFICEKDNIQNTIKELNSKLTAEYGTAASDIPTLPDVVSYQNVAKEFGKTNEYIIGLSKENLSISKFDFRKNCVNLISSNDMLLNYKFILPFIKQAIAVNKQKIMIINADDFELNEQYQKYMEYYNSNFDKAFEKLNQMITEKYELYKQNNYNKNIFANEKSTLCIIIGIDNFKNRLNNDNKLKFANIFDSAKDLDIINYLLVDSVDKFKKIEFESWYKNNVNTNEGIWIGNGINEQFVIKYTQKTPDMKLNIADSFCFVITRGKPELVKYLENINIKFN